MRQGFRTRDLPAGDRFASWMDIVSRDVMSLGIRSNHGPDFDATFTAMSLGDIRVVDARNPPVQAVRTLRRIRQSDPESYQVALNLAGHQLVSQERNDSLLRPGDFVFNHSSRVFHTRGDPSRGMQRSLIVSFPCSTLPIPAMKMRQLLAVRQSTTDALGSFLRGYLRALAFAEEPLDSADALRLGAITLDVIITFLARRLDLANPLGAESRARTMRARVESFILARLDNPDLRPETIATAHYMSVRSLHRLFRTNDLTVARFIHQQRLQRCQRDLRDPRLAILPVRTIGARWGFPDAAHFTRAFTSEYGISPAWYRATSTPT